MTDTPLSDDVVELCAGVIERKFYEYVDDPPMPGSRPFEHIARAALEAARYGEIVWRPIETAPKDGTVIDLWCVWTDTQEGERLPDSYWGVSTIAFEDEEIEGWVGGHIGIDGCEAIIDTEDREVTHWMPLPDPPRALLSSIGASHE